MRLPASILSLYAANVYFHLFMLQYYVKLPHLRTKSKNTRSNYITTTCSGTYISDESAVYNLRNVHCWCAQNLPYVCNKQEHEGFLISITQQRAYTASMLNIRVVYIWNSALSFSLFNYCLVLHIVSSCTVVCTQHLAQRATNCLRLQGRFVPRTEREALAWGTLITMANFCI
jgi:hypothetical protein